MPISDDARCRIVLLHPPLPGEAAERLRAACGKLLAQFAREGRCDAWSATVEHDGAALVLAWEPSAPLSGCSHDKIAALLAAHGRDPVPPPFCVRLDHAWTCLDRAGLRARAHPGTPLLDHRRERLGDWRAHGLTTVAASWAAPILRAPGLQPPASSPA